MGRRGRVEPRLVVPALDDLLRAADRTDEQEDQQLLIVVVTRRAVVKVVARRGRQWRGPRRGGPAGRPSPVPPLARTALAAPLRDRHVGRNGAFHGDDRLARELLGDRRLSCAAHAIEFVKVIAHGPRCCQGPCAGGMRPAPQACPANPGLKLGIALPPLTLHDGAGVAGDMRCGGRVHGNER